MVVVAGLPGIFGGRDVDPRILFSRPYGWSYAASHQRIGLDNVSAAADVLLVHLANEGRDC